MDRNVTLLDGAMGTELKARGVDVPDHTTSIWSAKALRNDPQTIVDIHRAYIDAGAEVITINNYAVTPPLLRRDGWEDDFAPLTEIAMDLAEQARDESGASVRIAGSLPPLETSYRADLVGADAEILETYAVLARAQMALDEPTEAIASTLDEYTGILTERRLRLFEGELHELRARLASRTGATARAAAAELREAHRLYTEMGATGHAERLAKELDL